MRIERMIEVEDLRLKLVIDTQEIFTHSQLSKEHAEVEMIVDTIVDLARHELKQYRAFLREKYGR